VTKGNLEAILEVPVNMLRVAMLSGWHVHARGYAQQLQKIDGVKITAVWDEQQDRGRKWASDLDVDFVPDLNAVLGRADVDAVVVNAPTNRHAEIMVAAAGAGKHIFTEKVMALTVEECREVAAAVEKAGVKFTISFPQRTSPQALFAKRVAEEGLIGDITLMRTRNAHDGASSDWLPDHFYDPVACGGGALIDLGAHPMYMIRWILGQPKRITATLNSFTGKPVDDNAVAVVEFENKAIGIAETAFVSHQSPAALELYGTEGSLLIGGAEGGIRIYSRLLNKGDVNGWITPTNLPKALPSPLVQWVDAIVNDGPIRYGVEEGTQLTELMEAATISHREGHAVDIPF